MKKNLLAMWVFWAMTSSLQAQLNIADSYAQFAIGGGIEAILFVVNNISSETDTVLIAPQQGNLQTWAGSWPINGQDFTGSSAVNLTLGPKETSKLVFQGDAITRAGYLLVFKLESTESFFFYNFLDGNGQLLDSVGITASLANDAFLFPVEKQGPVNTAFAWISLDTDPFDITLTLFDALGVQFDQQVMTFDGHLAKFFDEIFTTVGSSFTDMLQISSEQLLNMVVQRLEFTSSGFQLTSIPPGIVNADGTILLGESATE